MPDAICVRCGSLAGADVGESGVPQQRRAGLYRKGTRVAAPCELVRCGKADSTQSGNYRFPRRRRHEITAFSQENGRLFAKPCKCR